jgi:hypothetical protein
MPIRIRTVALSLVVCAALVAPSVTSAGEVHAARARVVVKPRLGDPHTKMVVQVSGFKASETLLAKQFYRSVFDNLFVRKFTYKAGTDGTLDVTLRRPQKVGRYEMCFKGRSSGRRACGTYRVNAEP